MGQKQSFRLRAGGSAVAERQGDDELSKYAGLSFDVDPAAVLHDMAACSVTSQPWQQRQNSKGNQDWRDQDKAPASCHRARGRFSSRHSTE